MRLFDAHCHLQAEVPARGAVMRRAASAGVAGFNCCGCREADWLLVLELAREYPEVYPSLGLHPCLLGQPSAGWEERLERLLREHDAGVGEAGLDGGADNMELQEKVLLRQWRLAQRLSRPLTVHCRNAWGRLLEIIRQEGTPAGGMLLHAYSGSVEVMRELTERGCYISFAGNITRPHHKRAREVLRRLPLKYLLLETDAPDLTPAGAAGEINEPGNLPLVLAAAAELRGMPAAELAAAVYDNSRRLFSRQGAPAWI